MNLTPRFSSLILFTVALNLLEVSLESSQIINIEKLKKNNNLNVFAGTDPAQKFISAANISALRPTISATPIFLVSLYSKFRIIAFKATKTIE
jgi:hypothetical protein